MVDSCGLSEDLIPLADESAGSDKYPECPPLISMLRVATGSSRWIREELPVPEPAHPRLPALLRVEVRPGRHAGRGAGVDVSHVRPYRHIAGDHVHRGSRPGDHRAHTRRLARRVSAGPMSHHPRTRLDGRAETFVAPPRQFSTPDASHATRSPTAPSAR